MTKQKKLHWSLIFTLLISFTVFSLTSLLNGNGDIKLAQAVDNVNTSGPGSDIAIMFLMDASGYNRPTMLRNLNSEGITYCLPTTSMRGSLSQVFSEYNSVYEGISVISLTNSDMQDQSVVSKLNTLDSAGFTCRGFRANRLPFLSPLHVS